MNQQTSSDRKKQSLFWGYYPAKQLKSNGTVIFLKKVNLKECEQNYLKMLQTKLCNMIAWTRIKTISMKIPLYELLCCLLRHHLGFLSGLSDHGPDFLQANRQIPHLVTTLLRGHNQLTSPVYLVPVLKDGKTGCDHWNLVGSVLFWHWDIETMAGRGGLVPSEPFFVSQLRESSRPMPGGTEPLPWNSLGGKNRVFVSMSQPAFLRFMG